MAAFSKGPVKEKAAHIRSPLVHIGDCDPNEEPIGAHWERALSAGIAYGMETHVGSPFAFVRNGGP